VIDSTFAHSVHIGGKSTFLDHRRRWTGKPTRLPWFGMERIWFW